jgi:hypothetical protein
LSFSVCSWASTGRRCSISWPTGRPAVCATVAPPRRWPRQWRHTLAVDGFQKQTWRDLVVHWHVQGVSHEVACCQTARGRLAGCCYFAANIANRQTVFQDKGRVFFHLRSMAARVPLSTMAA